MPMPMPMPPPTQIAIVAHRLRVDARTGEVIAAMRASGIRAVLLKGPAIAHWLYAEDPSVRGYADADLIVAPGDPERARALLCDLGFDALPHDPVGEHARHARTYVRSRDGAIIDLHTTLHGLERIPRERAWRAVSTGTETLEVGKVALEIPSRPVRLLHLALRLDPRDDVEAKAWLDLERGLATATPDEWRAATALARSLGVERELAVPLRRLPAGAALADRLGLTRHVSPDYRLREAISAGDAPRGALSVFGFATLPDWHSRFAYAWAKLPPDDSWLRERSALAQAGHVRTARAVRAARVLIGLPAALRAWITYQRG